jgi:nucleoside phosphorylase
VVEATYIDGYADSLGALIVGDLVYLASPFELTAEAAFSYAKAAQALKVLDVLAVLDHANVNELLRLKSSSAWQELWPILRHGGRLDEKAERLAREARKVAEGHHRFPRMGRLDCQIGVVTALPEEYVAMKRMLVGAVSTKVPGDTNEYTVGEIEARRNGRRIGSHRVALTLTKRTGTESAATTATNLLRSFPVIRLVLMVGIACGIPNPSDPDKHVRLGDIVVSDRQGIVDPTSGVAEAGGVKHRELILPPGAALTQAVNLLEAEELERGERPWQARIEQLIADHEKFKRPGPSTDVLLDANLEKVDHPIDKRRRGRARQPLVFRGPIGSSNLLSRDVGFREELAAKHGLRAIEMEGAGIANAAWDRSQPYGVIRASCDYGDPSKNDRWHHYAAGAAAAYAACAIARIAPCDLRDE